MARIRIEDLPVRVQLTPEEMELLWGAGRRPAFRPQIEGLEDRFLLSASALSLAGAPAAPALTASAASATQINLAWNRVAGASGYVIDEWVNGAPKQIVSVDSRYGVANVTQLNPGSTYYFDVAAVNGSGTTWSGWHSATTFPAAPSLGASAVSPVTVSLSWGPVAGATGYVVDELIHGAWQKIGAVGSGTSGVTVSPCSPGTTYTFAVGAANASGTSWSYTRSVTTPQVDHPAAKGGYLSIDGTLFGGSGPSFLDVQQGIAGDCWLMASFAAVAARVPGDITSMFTHVGTAVENGSTVDLYSVRFFDPQGAAHSVVVDTELPGGGMLYDHPTGGGVFWAALGEKAYVEANALGYVRSNHVGSDSYSALDGGDPDWALQAITGRSSQDKYLNTGDLAAAWNAGLPVVLDSNNQPVDGYLVGGHAHALVGYNPSSSHPFEVYNPWGQPDSSGMTTDGKGDLVRDLFWANAAYLSQNFHDQAAVTAAAPTPTTGVITQDVLNAMEALRMSRATAQQRALVFINNDVINRARLNGWIPDSTYQAAQADFKLLNDNFAQRAAQAVGGEFKVQVAKKQVFSPGTDSDYIIKLKASPDPVGDVRSMQQLYNANVNKAIDLTFGADVGQSLHRDNWHEQLDVDFMVDPKYATADEFKQIADLNNAAYSRRLAADYERVSRATTGEVITDAMVRDYTVQMQELMKDKQAHLATLDADPRMLSDPTFSAEYQRLMALEQKYIDRMEAVNVAYRKQNNLPVADPPYSEPHYEVTIDANGEAVMSYRTSETIAAQGAVRAPENLRTTATASSLAPLTSQRALTDIAESMVEANLANTQNGRPMAEVGQDLAQITESLPLSEQGRLIETLRERFGPAVATEVVKGYRAEYGSAAADGTTVDQVLKNGLGVSDDLRQMSDMRRAFNETAAQFLGAIEKPLGVVGNALLIKDTLGDMKTYWTSIRQALDPNTTDADADKLFAQAEQAAQSMAINGGLGAVFTQVPTLGAMYGTFQLSYTGSRFILENTKLGQWIDRTADHYADRFLQSYDRAVDSLTQLLGGTSDAQTRQDQLLALEGNFIRLLKDGKIKLNDNVTGLQVLQYIRSGDLWGLDELIKKDTSSDVVALHFTPADHAGGAVPQLPSAGNMTISDTLQGVYPSVTYSISLNQGDQVSLDSYVPYVTDQYGTHSGGLGPNGSYGMGGINPIIKSDTGVWGGSPGFTAPRTGTYGIGVADFDWEGQITAPVTLTIKVTPATPAAPPEVITPDMVAPGPSSTLDQRVGWLNAQSASTAADVIWQYDWDKAIATLNQMTAQRVAQTVWNYSWEAMTATLDRMSAQRVSQVITNYANWTDRIATLDHMSAKRVFDVIGNYNSTDRQAFLDHMTPQRAAEVLNSGPVNLAAPTLVGPTGSTGTTTPTFSWNPVPGADHYDVWVSVAGDTTYAQVLRNQSVAGTSITFGGQPLTPGKSYSFWVMAYDASGNHSGWSSKMDFSLTAAATNWTASASLGGPAKQVVVGRNLAGNEEMFAIAKDNTVWHRWQAGPNSSSWSNWVRLGGSAKKLVVANDANGALDVCYIGTDNAVWHVQENSDSSWNNPVSLGGYAKDLAVGKNADGRLEVFYIGNNNAVWHRWQTAPSSPSWSAEYSLGGSVKQVAVGRNLAGNEEIFAIANDNSIWHLWQAGPNSSSWSNWVRLGGSAQKLVVANDANGALDVCYIGTDNAVWHIQENSDSSWNTPVSLGGYAKDLAVGRNADGRLEVFYIGNNNAVWHRWQTAANGGWSNEASLGGSASQITLGQMANGALDMFGLGLDSNVWHRNQV